jgi:putative transposase
MIPNPAKTIIEFIAKDRIEPAILAQNDYLRAENEILRKQLERLNLSLAERIRLAELGLEVRKYSKDLFKSTINIVKPDTLLKWHRQYVAKKFDGSANRTAIKQKRITKEIEDEIVRIAREDETAGYGKIVGYLDDLGINYTKPTIAKILKKHGVHPAPERKEDLTWNKFIKAHIDAHVGCDFFTKEVWTCKGLVTYYILVFIHLGSRRLFVQNMTINPTEKWATQQMRNFVYDMHEHPEKKKMRFLTHDKGTQFTESFDLVFTSENKEKNKAITSTYVQMNAHCERVIQTIQNECTEKMIFIGEKSLRYSLKQFEEHYNNERHHQGIGNIIPFPHQKERPSEGVIKCKTRLGGMLRRYYREAA